MRLPRHPAKLAAGDAARFLTDVARSQRGNDEPLAQAAPRPVAAKKEPALASAGHPAGERQSQASQARLPTTSSDG